MTVFKSVKLTLLAVILVFGIAAVPQSAKAHCDSVDGPVVTDAKKALESGDLHHVLIWITEEQEQEVRDSFEETLAVRTESERARELADRYFFETVVRLHRESEGAAYTGLKPAGTELAPFVPKVDEALKTGNPQEIKALILDHFEQGLHEHFVPAYEARDFDEEDVRAGRDFVHKYVELLHYVKPVFEAIQADHDTEASAHSH